MRNNIATNNIITNNIVTNNFITYLCAMENKPFIFGKATSGDNFTDREKETSRLLSNFRSGINTILISPRRWGKTSLVKKVCKRAQSDKLKVVYLDIFSCRSDREFYDAFASAVLKQTSSKFEEMIESAKIFLSRINPKFTIGPDPMLDFSVSLELKTESNDVEEILQLPEKIAQKKGLSIVVCIDEFQQIAEFKDSKTFQKRLRSVWQLQNAVSYCLFGSKKHLMNELFEKKSLPFYKFGDVIYLPKISTEDWITYICERFESTGKHISRELAERVCLAVENHSSYVQQLAWLLWVHTREEATEQDFIEAHQDLIDQNRPLFEKQTERLSSYQMNFLRALVDGVHNEFTTQTVLQKYKLGSSANVSIIKRALIKKELIETENKKTYFADPVMRLWLKQEFSSRKIS